MLLVAALAACFSFFCSARTCQINAHHFLSRWAGSTSLRLLREMPIIRNVVIISNSGGGGTARRRRYGYSIIIIKYESVNLYPTVRLHTTHRVLYDVRVQSTRHITIIIFDFFLFFCNKIFIWNLSKWRLCAFNRMTTYWKISNFNKKKD